MSEPVLLLVTGSRALASFEPARRWLRDELATRGPAVVVTGDAPGPDGVAAWWVGEQPWPAPELRAYCLDGHRRDWWSQANPPRWVEPARMAEEIGLRGRRRWPLFRNTVMVHDVEKVAHLFDVTVLALKADWSATQGTAHTAGLARRLRLPVVERVFSRGGAR